VAERIGFALDQRETRAEQGASGPGLTLEAYAAAKKLPVSFLQGLGLKTSGAFGPASAFGSSALHSPCLGLGLGLAQRLRR